jgi:hypothetical protein
MEISENGSQSCERRLRNGQPYFLIGPDGIVYEDVGAWREAWRQDFLESLKPFPDLRSAVEFPEHQRVAGEIENIIFTPIHPGLPMTAKERRIAELLSPYFKDPDKLLLNSADGKKQNLI